jgi:ferric-dicitrate binding protein FerR (iron transport regulator)
MNEPRNPSPESEEERLLRENLNVRALSPEALQRIRVATEAEWRAQVAPMRRRWIPVAAVASIALLAAGATWSILGRGPGTVAGAPLARLERAAAPGVVESLSWWREAAVPVGAEIRGGQEFAARGASLFMLHDGGNLRIAQGSEFEVVAGNTLRLRRGEMYVDIPPGSRPAQSFVAITPAGEFRHVGTQFALAVIDGATRLRVREGSVRWQSGEAESTVKAGSEMIIDVDRRVAQRAIDASGPQWAWSEAMAPAVVIEDRPLSEFLDWVARETGRKLIIADENARRQIETIRMHGDVHGFEPLRALEAVIASTSLHLELPAGAIRVSFASVSPQTPH